MKISKLWEYIKSPGVMAIIAILSFAFGIYQYTYQKKPGLLIKTETISPVFNVLQSVGGLQISYAGKDLRNSKQLLWVMVIAITNNGSAVIKKGDYDNSVPFGIAIQNGQVVEAPTVTSTNKYLQENLKPSYESNKVIFSPVILEPRDTFKIRILVLGSEKTIPYVTAFAEIAGLEKIELATPDSPESKNSYWSRITEADTTWIQLARIPVYGIGGLMALMLLMIPFMIIIIPLTDLDEWVSKQKRRRKITTYKPNEEIDWETRTLIDTYIEYGEDAIKRINRIIKRAETRCALIKQFEPINSDGKFDEIIRRETALIQSRTLEELEKNGLIRFEGIKPIWPDGLKKSIDELANHLGIDLDSKPYLETYRPIDYEISGVQRYARLIDENNR